MSHNLKTLKIVAPRDGDLLLPTDYGKPGRLNTMDAILGGNVRVGLEDSLYIGKGKLAMSNAEQVAKIRRIIEDLSFDLATPEEARKRLGLKGVDQTMF